MTGKLALTRGAVKPWHVMLMFFTAWSVGIVGGYKATHGIAGPFSAQIRDIATQGIFSAIIFLFVAIVPEFRRSLSGLFVAPRIAPRRSDLVLSLAVLMAWGYGLYRTAVCLPILLNHPEAFRTLRFSETLVPFEPKYLVAMIGAALVAPIAEELVFRGYLLNLLLNRRSAAFSVAATSVAFGVFHLETGIFAAPAGIVFALLYLRYDSLWPAVFVHSAYNILAFPWLVGGLFYVRSPAALAHVSGWIPELLISAVFFPLAFWFWRRLKPTQ